MAEETVNYRAKSVVVSKTMIVNVLAIAATVLGSDQLKAMLGPEALPIVATVLGFVNMVLRFYTVRPVAIIGPNESKAVPVEKLPTETKVGK